MTDQITILEAMAARWEADLPLLLTGNHEFSHDSLCQAIADLRTEIKELKAELGSPDPFSDQYEGH